MFVIFRVCLLYPSRIASLNEIPLIFLTKFPQRQLVVFENTETEVSQHLNVRKVL